MTIAETIHEAVRRIIAESRPSRIILFGSYARNEPREHSDLDLLVVVPVVADRRDEMIRLQHRLRGLGIPVDVLVFSERQVAEWGDVRGTVLYPALREGIVLYEAA